MTVYNPRTVITGDIDGIIRCWDIRTNLHKNNKSQRQFQAISTSLHHELREHEEGINCFEAVPNKHRLMAGSGDGRLSVWDLRKSSDLDLIKIEMNKKKKKKNKKNKYDLFGMEEEEEIKPKTLKAISDRMGDEILSLCLMKYDKKLCCGMTSGFMNIFSWNEWEWYGDRVRGHSEHLNCIIKYDEDCCITGCDDGVVRLISLYPHKFLHSIGSHDLMPIDHIAASSDKSYVISFASGNNKRMIQRNRTNKVSTNKKQKEVIKLWDMDWSPNIIHHQKQKEIQQQKNRKRHLNQHKLPKGVKLFLELEDDDYTFSAFDELDHDEIDTKKQQKEAVDDDKNDDYQFSDDSLDDLEHDDFDDLDSSNDSDLQSENVENEQFTDTMSRRIRYKTFEDREHWIKSLGSQKKIRPFGKHDIEQYHNRKFFRDLC